MTKQHSRIIILGLLVGTFFLWACSKQEEAKSDIVKKSPQINGLVTAKNNTPLPDIAVSLYTPNSIKSHLSLQTNTAGKFTFDKPPYNTYRLWAKQDSTIISMVQNITYSAQNNLIELGIIEQSDLFDVDGVVTLSTTNSHSNFDAGLFNSDISVRILESDIITTTGETGTYNLELPKGSYTVSIHKPGYKELQLSLTLGLSTSNQTLKPSSLEMEESLGILIGNSQLEGHSDHSGTLVTLTELGITTNTDTKGDFQFQVPIGYYSSLTYARDNYAPTTNSETLLVSDTTQGVASTIILKGISNTLSGKVTLQNLTNFENINVQLVGTTITTTTNANGNYTFEDLPLETYTLQFSFPDCKTITTSTTIIPGPPITVPDQLLIPLGALSGIVSLQLRTDFSDILIGLDGTSITTETNSNGSYLIDNIPIGLYNIAFIKEGYTPSTKSNVSIEKGKTTVIPTFTILDGTPPISTHNADNIWHNKDIIISLNASDKGTGLDTIFYRRNNGPTKDVKIDGPPIFTEEQSNNLLLWSTDKAGNMEAPKTITGINLDKTVNIFSVEENTNGNMKKLGDSAHFKVDTNETSGVCTLLFGSIERLLYDNGDYGDSIANDGIYEREMLVTDLTNIKVNEFTATFVDKATNVATSTKVGLIYLDGIKPEVPNNIVITPHTHQAQIDWSDNPEDDIAGYNIYRSLSETGSYQKLNNDLLTTSAYLDTELTNAIFYYYKIQAIDDAGNEGDLSSAHKTFPAYYVRGTFNSENWSPIDNPFILTDTATLNTGQTLTIEPGVDIWGKPQESLTIKGIIKAIGTTSTPITWSYPKDKLVPWDTPEVESWNGIIFNTAVIDSSVSLNVTGPKLEYCTINDATNGVSIHTGSAGIYNCLIEKNENGIYLLNSNRSYIHKNTISNNTTNGILIDATTTSEQNTIIDNTLILNTESGIAIGTSNSGNIGESYIYSNTITNTKVGIILGLETGTHISNLKIKYNLIEDTLNAAITTTQSDNQISYNTFKKAPIGIRLKKAASNTISNNLFQEFTEWAIDLEESKSNTIEHNDLKNNTNGIRLGSSSLKNSTNNSVKENNIHGQSKLVLLINSSPQTAIVLNNFYDNLLQIRTDIEPIVENGTASNLKVEQNYWGERNPSKIKLLIKDKSDDSNLGEVDFQPFENEKLTGSGILPE